MMWKHSSEHWGEQKHYVGGIQKDVFYFPYVIDF